MSEPICGPYAVNFGYVVHGVDGRRRVAICDQTPNKNVLAMVIEEQAMDVCRILNSQYAGKEPAYEHPPVE